MRKLYSKKLLTELRGEFFLDTLSYYNAHLSLGNVQLMAYYLLKRAQITNDSTTTRNILMKAIDVSKKHKDLFLEVSLPEFSNSVLIEVY